MPDRDDLTQTLLSLTRGDPHATDALAPVVYEKLRALAEQYMRRERADHTLQGTALVNEAYLRLFDKTRGDWQGKAHFIAVAAEAMRHILVDHARRRAAAKRGGGWEKKPLDSNLADPDAQQAIDLIAIDEALAELKKLNSRQARVVELRFFGGSNVKETACVLGVSERTVVNDWDFARLWLQRWLSR